MLSQPLKKQDDKAVSSSSNASAGQGLVKSIPDQLPGAPSSVIPSSASPATSAASPATPSPLPSLSGKVLVINEAVVQQALSLKSYYENKLSKQLKDNSFVTFMALFKEQCPKLITVNWEGWQYRRKQLTIDVHVEEILENLYRRHLFQADVIKIVLENIAQATRVLDAVIIYLDLTPDLTILLFKHIDYMPLLSSIGNNFRWSFKAENIHQLLARKKDLDVIADIVQLFHLSDEFIFTKPLLTSMHTFLQKLLNTNREELMHVAVMLEPYKHALAERYNQTYYINLCQRIDKFIKYAPFSADFVKVIHRFGGVIANINMIQQLDFFLKIVDNIAKRSAMGAIDKTKTLDTLIAQAKLFLSDDKPSFFSSSSSVSTTAYNSASSKNDSRDEKFSEQIFIENLIAHDPYADVTHVQQALRALAKLGQANNATIKALLIEAANGDFITNVVSWLRKYEKICVGLNFERIIQQAHFCNNFSLAAFDKLPPALITPELLKVYFDNLPSAKIGIYIFTDLPLSLQTQSNLNKLFANSKWVESVDEIIRIISLHVNQEILDNLINNGPYLENVKLLLEFLPAYTQIEMNSENIKLVFANAKQAGSILNMLEVLVMKEKDAGGLRRERHQPFHCLRYHYQERASLFGREYFKGFDSRLPTPAEVQNNFQLCIKYASYSAQFVEFIRQEKEKQGVTHISPQMLDEIMKKIEIVSKQASALQGAGTALAALGALSYVPQTQTQAASTSAPSKENPKSSP